MSNLKELIILDAQNEYESAYDLSVNKNFSTPKIYSANGDLKSAGTSISLTDTQKVVN